MAVNNVNYNDTLREGTDKINQSINQSNEAITKANSADTKADNAVQTANEANTKSDDTQQQLNNIVINNGESDAEVLQARGSYSVLNERLQATDAQLAQRANQKIFLFETDLADITTILSDYMNNDNVDEIDLLKREYVVSSPLTITKKIKNGSIRFKNTGSFTVKDGGFLEHFTGVMDTSSLTSPAVLIFDGMNGYGDYIKIKPTNPVPMDLIGIHFKGSDLTCFNEVNNVHVRYARKGVYIDSTVGWVTAITMNNVRVDYFEEFAFKIGSDSGDKQNSQHNINNLTIQDTSDNTEETDRIGLSLGGTWNNVNNLVTFADRHTGTFTPLQMEDKTDKTVNHLLAYLKDARNNKLNGAILENNPNFNGLEYLHTIENVRMLRNDKIGSNKTTWTLPSTNKIKPLFTLKDSPSFVPTPNTKTNLIDSGNVTVTQTTESITLKNNTGVVLSGSWDIKIPTKHATKVQDGKYSTVLLQVVNGGYGLRAKNSTTDITTENINHLGTTPEGRISFYAFHNDETIKQAASVDDLLLRIGFSSLPANTTVTIKGFQYYNQLVPVINENTLDWIGTTNLMS